MVNEISCPLHPGAPPHNLHNTLCKYLRTTNCDHGFLFFDETRLPNIRLPNVVMLSAFCLVYVGTPFVE